MDTIDKWLKSLRLHKYTHLFKSLTYDEMLNLEENYLIEREVTKGARNKMLISVKKLNLRQERLMNMMDDLEQDNISMKEALTVLKDMLITPIPYPKEEGKKSRQILTNENLLITATNSANNNNNNNNSKSKNIDDHNGDYKENNINCLNQSEIENITNIAFNRLYPSSGNEYNNKNNSSNDIYNNDSTTVATNTNNNYRDPYDLTYLFIETLEKVAQRLIESAGLEDNACHGIMASIVDECLKHNSFTREQKAKVASYKQHLTKEQTAKMASYKHHLTKEQTAKVASYKHHLIKEQTAKMASYKNQQQYNNINNISINSSSGYNNNIIGGSRHQPQTYNYNQFHHHINNINSNNSNHYHNGLGSIGQRQQNQYQFNNININNNSINNTNYNYHHHYNNSQGNSYYHWNHQPSLSSSASSSSSSSCSSASSTCSSSTAPLSSIGSNNVFSPKYSLFKPVITFELPFLRALSSNP